MILIEGISVVWNSRAATLKECTEDFIVFIERLKRFDSRFSTWCEGGNNRKEAMRKKVIFEYNYIKKKFCKKCDDNDYPEYSFLISFWNGAKTNAESYGIRASLGGNTTAATNSCVLSFPYKGEIYEHYLIKENKQKLRNLFIDHWNPDKVLDDEGKWVEL